MPEASLELEHFRREWQTELSQHRRVHQAHDSTVEAADDAVSSNGVPFIRPHRPAHAIDEDALHEESPTKVYHAAIEAERQGRLDAATRLYRRAFRLDANVERHYHELAIQQQVAEASGGAEPAREADELAFSFARNVQLEADDTATKPTTSSLRDALLTSIDQSPYRVNDETNGEAEGRVHEDQYAYHPRDEARACHFARLPVEITTRILVALALPDERAFFPRISLLEVVFGRLGRRARLDALEAEVWRSICERVYRPPISAEGFDVLARRFRFDYRRMWLEQPRLRTDGIWIGVQRYIRKGQSDNAWVNPSQSVVYYRYLRCASIAGPPPTYSPHSSPLPVYANGAALSLQTTVEPEDIVRQLRSGLRVPELLEGTFTLAGDRLQIRLEDVSKPARHRKYTFQLEAQLKSTKRGRQDRLKLLRLATLDRASSELEALPLSPDHARPFSFHMCRSYEIS